MTVQKKERWREPYRTGQKAFTKKEFEKVLSKVGVLEDEILILLGVNTGMRRRDITSIEVKNIDLKNQSVIYYEHKKRRTRTIFISSEMTRKLEIYLNTLPKKQERLFGFRDRTAYNRLNRYCRLAGIPERPFHALRATCIKFCQQAGWTLAEVAELTGDSIRTIQEHYETPSIEEMKETSETKRIT
jgi:integrase/recombinase XerD